MFLPISLVHLTIQLLNDAMPSACLQLLLQVCITIVILMTIDVVDATLSGNASCWVCCSKTQLQMLVCFAMCKQLKPTLLFLRVFPIKPFTSNLLKLQCCVAAANCSGDLVSNEFVSNYARSGGGVWQTTTGNYVVFNNRFTANNATLGSGGYEMTNCSSCDFSLNQFTFNQGQQGAGLYLGQSIGSVDSCYFDNNTANAYGGALFLDTDSANVTSCTFDNNFAYLIGGSIYGQRGTGSIESSIFSSNSARYANGVYWNAWDGLINTNNALAAADILFDASTGNSAGIQGTDSFSTGNQGSSPATTDADGVETDVDTSPDTSNIGSSSSTINAGGVETDDTSSNASPASSDVSSSPSSSSSSSTTTPTGAGINVG